MDKIISKLYVCTAKDCDFSDGAVGLDKDNKPRMVEVTTRKGNKKWDFASPPYGVVSDFDGKTKTTIKPVCPVCGAVCTQEEDGRHKFLRVNAQRIGQIREKMRLVGNTMKGAQYSPTPDDLVKVQKILYAEFDTLSALIDHKAERLANPDSSHKRAGNVKLPFTL